MKARTIGEIMEEVKDDIECFLHGFNTLKSEEHEERQEPRQGE